MLLRRKPLQCLGLLALFTAANACEDGSSTADDNEDCAGAKCDNAPGDEDGADLTCAELILDKSGRGLDAATIAANEDAFAAMILNAEGNCQLSVADILEALEASGCVSPGTQFVSERSQLLERFTDYRAVTQITCPVGGSRPRFPVFLHYTLLANEVTNGSEIDADLLQERLDHLFPAIMAEQPDSTFNFYQSRNRVTRVCVPGGDLDGAGDLDALAECEATSQCGDGELCLQRPDDLGVEADIRFFGNSVDFLDLPDRRATFEEMSGVFSNDMSTEADVDRSLDIERNCAACHPNGGLTMRELETPWVHWEHPQHFFSPGTEELIEKSGGILGVHFDGFDFERQVKTANEEHAGQRVVRAMELARDGVYTTGDVLRPLFCSDEFNIETTAGIAHEPLEALPFLPILENRYLDRAPIREIGIAPEDYEDLIESAGWSLWGFALGAFGLDPAPTETIGTLTYLTRSHIEDEYVGNLIRAGIIDGAFRDDVRGIDFTRPVFSEERCALLKWADRVPTDLWVGPDGRAVDNAPILIATEIANDMEAEGIGFDFDGPERDFLFAMWDTATDTQERIDDFMTACSERDSGPLFDDYIRVVGNIRKRAGDAELGLASGEPGFLQFRFPGANGFIMPESLTQAYQPGLRFHPETCELTTTYRGQ